MTALFFSFLKKHRKLSKDVMVCITLVIGGDIEIAKLGDKPVSLRNKLENFRL